MRQNIRGTLRLRLGGKSRSVKITIGTMLDWEEETGLPLMAIFRQVNAQGLPLLAIAQMWRATLGERLDDEFSDDDAIVAAIVEDGVFTHYSAIQAMLAIAFEGPKVKKKPVKRELKAPTDTQSPAF
jgi:hypothetical protein